MSVFGIFPDIPITIASAGLNAPPDIFPPINIIIAKVAPIAK